MILAAATRPRIHVRRPRLWSFLHETKEKHLPLPPLPLPNCSNPAFWITSFDAEDILYPLYDRGWGVKFYPRPLINPPVNDRYVAHLVTDFTFTKYSCAAEFIAELNFMCEEERHHPSTFTVHNHGRLPSLSLFVQTRQAFRPRWRQENPSANPPLSRRVPGITRRDLRFAILLERIYNSYLINGLAIEKRGTLLKHHFDQPTWDHLLTRFIKSTLNKGPVLNPPGGPPSPLSGLASAFRSMEDVDQGGNDVVGD